ncbi:MAG TPA: homoserine kinase [Actinomycetota bacterium]|nr:homoserine kinase [Actinomycetota bacterium]
MRLVARVPATVANLGPGFDALGLAVGLHNEVVADTDAAPSVEVRGEGAGELPADASNLVFRAMTYLSREAGRPLHQMALRCTNRIPLERGLGSSAAAVVAGLLLGDRLLATGLGADALLEMAIDLEGHADNVAACLRGGLVVAYLSRLGWRAEALEPHPALRPVLLVPSDERLATQDARRVLPREVPLPDAAFNVARASLAVLALTERPHLLAEALEDRLHQPRRLPLVPSSRAVFEELRSAGVPVCVAGSGPSLVGFEVGGAAVPELGPRWRAIRVEVAPGATVEEVAAPAGRPGGEGP